ncbi:MAG: hypothetical protein RL441_707, partial [Actinomycetota bacterium]
MRSGSSGRDLAVVVRWSRVYLCLSLQERLECVG